MDMTKVKAIADGVDCISKRFDSFLERRKDKRGDAAGDGAPPRRYGELLQRYEGKGKSLTEAELKEFRELHRRYADSARSDAGMSDKAFYKTERTKDLEVSLRDAKSEVKELEDDLAGKGEYDLSAKEIANVKKLLADAKADVKLLEAELASRRK